MSSVQYWIGEAEPVVSRYLISSGRLLLRVVNAVASVRSGPQ